MQNMSFFLPALAAEVMIVLLLIRAALAVMEQRHAGWFSSGLVELALLIALAVDLVLWTDLLQPAPRFWAGDRILRHRAAALAIQCGALALLYGLEILHTRRTKRDARSELYPGSIRAAIDNFHGGICFAMPNGVPILTNLCMNNLACHLTGGSVLDADVFWNDLLAKSESDSLGDSGDTPTFRLPDGNIWQFRRTVLSDREPHFIQLEAAPLTSLYVHRAQIQARSRELAQQRQRLQNLLQNVVSMNQEKERLAIKMNIHDAFGQCILRTRQYLQHRAVGGDLRQITGLWADAIRDLSGIAPDEPAAISPEAELLRVAEMIGCRLEFHGDRPKTRGNELLFYAAVREALTNAVRHAGADCLFVSARSAPEGFCAEISDNGNVPVSHIVEGDGLGTLRKRLEAEGAQMTVVLRQGVVLELCLPPESDQSGEVMP